MKITTPPLRIPEGYELVELGRTQCLIREGYRNILDCISSAGKKAVPVSGPHISSIGEGRNGVTRIRLLSTDEESVVFRRCRRGTFVERFLGDIYISLRTRMFQEARLTAYALHEDVPVAEVLIAAKERLAPFLYRGWIVTREIPDSQDLFSFLQKQPGTLTQEELLLKRSIITMAAETIAQMHDAGIYHWDLHIRNIILQKQQDGMIQIYLIDFDKSKSFKTMRLASRIRNLMRLFRSLIKRPVLAEALTKRDIERFLLAYFRGDRKKRRIARKLIRRHLWLIYIHSLLWRTRGRPSNFEKYIGRSAIWPKKREMKPFM